MKNLIDYLYSIDITNIDKHDDYYLLKDNHTTYLFSKYNHYRDFDFIYNICDELNKHYFYVYKLKKNIYNNVLSTIDNEEYYLLDIGLNYDNELDFYEMVNFYKRSSVFLNRNFNFKCNWDILWENKIDYLHLHANNYLVSNKNISPLFFYYLGLAENALIYIKTIEKNMGFFLNDRISFTHRRMPAPIKNLFFYNPFNLMIDLEVRDIAEYIKSMYYNDLDYLNDLEYYLKTNLLTKYSASMLYARIVYPSNFFDYYENKSEEYFSGKFSDTSGYESFIKKTYELINSYVNIDKISWL